MPDKQLLLWSDTDATSQPIARELAVDFSTCSADELRCAIAKSCCALVSDEQWQLYEEQAKKDNRDSRGKKSDVAWPGNRLSADLFGKLNRVSNRTKRPVNQIIKEAVALYVVVMQTRHESETKSVGKDQ